MAMLEERLNFGWWGVFADSDPGRVAVTLINL